ncbi:MAG: DNA-directed RNA polymerase subunit omega [Clostridia bacterium]|nr:DNA-directed RNA polymerase subunit omega [Clostridia bacterium]
MDMKKLSTEQLVKDKEISRYSLISGVAKRARAIAEENEANGIHTDEKTVVTAAEQYADGLYEIVSHVETEE